MTIKILQLLHHVDSIPGDLAVEIAQALSHLPKYEFCFGALGETTEALNALSLSSDKHGFGLSSHDVGRYTPRACDALADYISSQHIDIVITHRYKPARLLSKIARKIRCDAFLSVWHGCGEFDKLSRRIISHTAMLDKRWHHVGVSDAVADDLHEHMSSKTRISTIHNGVDIDKLTETALSRKNAREALELPADALVLGTVGRAVAKKGHTFLVAAFAELLEQFPNSYLVIIGGGEQEESLRDQARKLAIESHVRIAGQIQGASRLMQAFDIFVMPSLNEGFGLSALEAMALGIPVLGSDAGGIPEALGPGGLFFQRGCADSIGNALRAFLTSGGEAQQRYRSYLWNRARANFAIPYYRNAFRDLVQAVIE